MGINEGAPVVPDDCAAACEENTACEAHCPQRIPVSSAALTVRMTLRYVPCRMGYSKQGVRRQPSSIRREGMVPCGLRSDTTHSDQNRRLLWTIGRIACPPEREAQER